MICEQELDLSHPLVLYCKSLYEKISEKIPNKNNIYHVIHPSKIEDYQNYKYITDDSISEYVTIVKSILISNNFKCDLSDNQYIIDYLKIMLSHHLVFTKMIMVGLIVK